MPEKSYTLTKKQLNAEKNKAIAKFASIASHDLKNVIGGLSNIAYYFSKAFKFDGETPNKMLSLLSTEVSTLNKRITDLLDMTRVKQLAKSKCDIKDLISQAVNDAKAEGITFSQQLISAQVYVDPLRMKQVFFNILTNAKDAMQNNGTISISMKTENDTILTTISDSGKGMDSETLENCFDPMFSTKLAKAVGMGLTVALQIAEMHNGSISISSEPAKGTDVTVALPILKEE